MFTCDLQDWDSENAREKKKREKKRGGIELDKGNKITSRWT